MRSFFVLMDTAPPYIYPNDPTLPRTAAFPICRSGKPGAAPFSITGQPNAMGGREVGGLASTLASHMDFAPESVDRVRRFWSAPAMAAKPGLKAVDMFREVGRGKIKALWKIGSASCRERVCQYV